MPIGVIESLDHEAPGIARQDGKTVFVDGALPGETVEYASFRRKPKYELAHLVSVLSASTVRSHLTAIAFGAADPGLAGRMAEYVTLHGTTIAEPIAALKAGLAAQIAHAADLALAAWGPGLLAQVGLGERAAPMQALMQGLNRLHFQPKAVDDAFQKRCTNFI